MWTWSELKTLLRKKEAEVDYSTYAALMWPAYYPYMGSPMYQPRDPHATVIYLTSDINQVNYTKEDVLGALRSYLNVATGIYLHTQVKGLEWFGPEKDVPVLRIDHSELQNYRQRFVEILNNRGIFWTENYPEYKPHVTITPEAATDGVYPSKLLLTPLELWWGGEHIKV